MEKLVLAETEYEFEKGLGPLKKSGAVYWCDEHQAYHLTPDHSFHLSEVEYLMSGGEVGDP